MACKKNFSRNTSCRATSAEGLKVCIEKLRTSVGTATGLMKLDRNEMVFYSRPSLGIELQQVES